MAWGLLGLAWKAAMTGLTGYGAYKADEEFNDGRATKAIGGVFDSSARGIRTDNPTLNTTLKAAENLTGIDLPGAGAPASSPQKPPTSTEFGVSATQNSDSPELFSMEWFTDMASKNAAGGAFVAGAFALGYKVGGWKLGAVAATVATISFNLGLKDMAEEFTGWDIDNDGRVGATGPAPEPI